MILAENCVSRCDPRKVLVLEEAEIQTSLIETIALEGALLYLTLLA